jgi:hypothetical protein
MHHETSGSVANYESHLDRAMDLMKKYDYPAVKTGYVGKIFLVVNFMMVKRW